MKLSKLQWQILAISGWLMAIVAFILPNINNKQVVKEHEPVTISTPFASIVDKKLDSLVQSISLQNAYFDAQRMSDKFQIQHLQSGLERYYDSAVFYDNQRIRLAKIAIAYRNALGK